MSSQAAPHAELDLDRLLKLRLLVARFGEMDRARWWNTRGVLGRLGETALKRGFATTHFFAQAGLVFAVAAKRCRDVFDPPRAMTLWTLPAEIEDRFDSQWPMWLEHAESWSSFFVEIQSPQSDNLLEEAGRLEVADDRILQDVRLLRRSAENRGVPLPGDHQPSDRIFSLLALSFFRSEAGTPAIPYARMGG